jgi:succinate dehydrogenase / fumarate reductase, cytochrome b subunit
MAGVSSERRARPRPLSPHLQIYRPLINMMMSILHRITGAALYVGTVLLAAWLISAATSPECFAAVNGLFASWPGMMVLVGYSWALIHHALGGMRHFIWDTGSALDIGAVDLLSWSTIVLSVLLTVVLWFYIGMQRGWVTAWQ